MAGKKNYKLILIKVLICLCMTLLLSSGFSVSSTVGDYILYLSPIIFIFLPFQIYHDIYSNSYDKKDVIMVIAFITSFICFPIFLGVYFGIYYPIFSLEIEKIENCLVTGVAPMNQASYEVYSILYVDFQYDGQKFLGYACTSDQTDNDQKYMFMKRGDYIICDEVGSSFDHDSSRILDQKNRQLQSSQRKRLLMRRRGNCQQRGKVYTSEYNFSDTKLPSWLCMPRSINYEELIKPKTCYVTFYKDKQIAYKNSKDRKNLKEVSNFALTQFEIPSYYPKSGYICLIVFTYLPFLLNFYPLSSYITDKIQKKVVKKYKKLHLK